MNDAFHIIFAPLLPVPWLIALVIIALLLSVFAVLRRARGALGRGGLFALLLLTLANPSLVGEKREALKDTALLVIDDSASMKLGNRAAQVVQAADSITKKLAAFPDLDVETLHVSGEDETDLFRAIEQKSETIASDRLAGIIALTDGQIHDAPTHDFNVPFHALIAGQKGEVDRRLVITASPAYALVGKQAAVTLRVDEEPKAQSENATVTISQGDGPAQTLTVPVGKDVQVNVAIDHAGANRVAFEVEPLPQELTPINNIATASINGIRDHLRVLLVSGEPHNGGRNWRNLLKADPAVDLIHFTILRSPLKENAVPNSEMSLIAFPAREIFDTKLKSFDLVIFDGFSNRSLIPDAYLANIANYVEKGGALLVADATGQQAAELSQSSLAAILPTAMSGDMLTGSFVPTLTDAGKRHPVTATLGSVMEPSLWSPWYRQVDARVTDTKTDVVMTGLNQKPLLVLSHVGQGRVAQFLSDQFWLWARDYPHGGPQAELLRRTAHWLVAEPDLDETALRAHAEKQGDGWQIRITKQSPHDDTAHVVVTGPDNQPLQVTLAIGDGVMDRAGDGDRAVNTPSPPTSLSPGTLHATVSIKQAGLYHVKDDNHDILVIAGVPNSPEFGAMVATDQVVQPIAQKSGGAVAWLADHPDGLDIRRTDKNAAQNGWNWFGLTKNGHYRVTGSEVYPLWPEWVALVVLLGAAMGLWQREGR